MNYNHTIFGSWTPCCAFRAHRQSIAHKDQEVDNLQEAAEPARYNHECALQSANYRMLSHSEYKFDHYG
jgi:hypothetical protein